MGARFRTLLRDDGERVTGVEYTADGAAHRVEADIVVAADGRLSKVRQVSRIVPTELGAHLDVLWYAVPRHDTDPPLSGLDLFAGPGTTVVLLGQDDSWQIGYDIHAGTLPDVRARGVDPIRRAVAEAAPWLADRLDSLTEVNQLTLLPVRITTVDRWTEPGLLLIGDAAHVISPVGGNGINLALADAAEAANQLVGPLRDTPGDGDRGAGCRSQAGSVRQTRTKRSLKPAIPPNRPPTSRTRTRVSASGNGVSTGGRPLRASAKASSKLRFREKPVACTEPGGHGSSELPCTAAANSCRSSPHSSMPTSSLPSA
jgi:2-polyprenyl-6-methoxyphenol hydroxylase-like FAD-dependent oxidoreductase